MTASACDLALERLAFRRPENNGGAGGLKALFDEVAGDDEGVGISPADPKEIDEFSILFAHAACSHDSQCLLTVSFWPIAAFSLVDMSLSNRKFDLEPVEEVEMECHSANMFGYASIRSLCFICLKGLSLALTCR